MFELFRRARADVKRLKAIDDLLLCNRRGVLKRIDENRELLELLQAESPELLDRCFWIAGWLEDQDRLLVELARVAQVVNPHEGRNISAVRPFPRPWPGEVSKGVQSTVSLQGQSDRATADR